MADANGFNPGDPYYDPSTETSGQQNPPVAPPPSGAPDTPAPGNDANQIQGWYSAYLGRNASQAELDALKGQPLGLVQNGVANSAEAQKYANRGKTDTGGGGGGGGGGGNSSPSASGGFQWPTYQPPTPYQFTPYSGFTPFDYQSYSPLTSDQAAQEPGYAFANQQGRDAIQTSQASKGNVLSGAALKDLFAWGDQFAGQNYQGAEARNENVYTMNRNNAYNNWAADETGKYQQWAGNQQYGLPAWVANNQPGQFGANLSQQQAGLTLNDLLQRFNTTTNSLTNIATAGAN